MDEFNRREKCTVFDKFDSCNTTYQVATDDWITINNQDNQSFFFLWKCEKSTFVWVQFSRRNSFLNWSQFSFFWNHDVAVVSWDAFSLEIEPNLCCTLTALRCKEQNVHCNQVQSRPSTKLFTNKSKLVVNC